MNDSPQSVGSVSRYGWMITLLVDSLEQSRLAGHAASYFLAVLSLILLCSEFRYCQLILSHTLIGRGH